MVVQIQHSPTGIPLKPWTYAECAFEATQSPVITNVGGVVGTEYVEDDRNMAPVTGASVTTEAQITSSVISTYRSLDESAATVSSGGLVSPVVLDGMSRTSGILIGGPRQSRRLECAVSGGTAGGTTQQLQSYVAGSLAKHDVDMIDPKLVGTTLAANGGIYSSHNPPVRSVNCWAKDIDTTPISYMSQVYGMGSQVTMITPRHAIGVDHAYMNIGDWLQFVGKNNELCQRTILGSVALTYQNGDPMDCIIYVLDSDVDNFISFVEVLPANGSWSPKLPSIDVTGITAEMLSYYLPLFIQDRSKRAMLWEWDADLQNSNYPDRYQALVREPVGGDRAKYAYNPISGDSGSARCMVLNNKLVFASMVSGVTLCWFLDRIAIGIAALGNNPNNYAVSVADLSSFPSYP